MGPTFVRIGPHSAISDLDARPVRAQHLRSAPELPKDFPTMPLDANSRFIAQVCGVAVILLATWFHGHGKSLDRGLSRCEAGGLQAREPRDCISCERDEASHADARRVDCDAPSPALRTRNATRRS